ncbi:MAG TPA: hypothetical protein VFZ23_16265 [Pyrinomonadaceae bacterium]
MALDLAQRAAFFDGFVEQTKTSIRFAWILAFAVFLTGVFCAVLINFLGPEDNTRLVGTIGSGLVTLLSAAPLKDYFGQRARINTFVYMKSRYERLSEKRDPEDDPEIEKLESIFYDLLKKNTGA